MASKTEITTNTNSSAALEVVRDGNIAGFRDELIYETITLQDCHYSESLNVFYYLCPCGDLFEFPLVQLVEGKCIYVLRHIAQVTWFRNVPVAHCAYAWILKKAI